MLCKQVVFVVFCFSLSVNSSCKNPSQKYRNAFLFKGLGENGKAVCYGPLFVLKVETGKEDGLVFLSRAYFCVYDVCLHTYLHIYIYERAYWP